MPKGLVLRPATKGSAKVPIMIVWGFPSTLEPSVLLRFKLQTLPQAVASIPEMKITPGQVTVFTPGDLAETFGEEVVVFAEGLFMRDERTAKVRKRFAKAVRDCVVEFVLEHVPNCTMVGVIPRSQRPDDGFADWHRDE